MAITVIHIALCLACLPLFVVGATGLVYALGGRRLAEERGQRPSHEARCGGRIGRRHYPNPFLRVAVYDRFVVIAGPRCYQLSRAAIDKVEVAGPRTPLTVRIHHHAADVPEQLEVWPEEVETLMVAIGSE